MSITRSSGRKSSVEDDDILEVRHVQPSAKAEEERRFLRQREVIAGDEMKFMTDFDPDNSLRNKKKSRRRYYYPDGRPMVMAEDYEVCDCLDLKCPGCHTPCKSCRDRRCGHECRVNRRWVYETVEIEGRNKILKHPHTESRYTT